MKNKVVLGIFLILMLGVLSAPALATKALNITTESVMLQGNSGTVSGSFSVRNIGNETINVTLSKTDATSGSRTIALNLPSGSITDLHPGVSATLSFNADLTDKYMGIYSGHVRADINDIPPMAGAYDEMPVTVNVTDNGMGLAVAAPSPATTETDSNVQQEITVTNYANKDITAAVTKGGYAQMSSFNVDKTGNQLFPAFQPTTLKATFKVPAGLASGTYWGSVNMTYGAVKTGANLQTNVLETRKVSVSTVTLNDVDPGATKSTTFSIQNTGNVNLTWLSLQNYTLADANGNIMNLTFSPTTGISIPVSSSIAVTAKADVSGKVAPGTYTQQVSVSGDGVSYNFNVNVAVNSLLKVTDVSVDPDQVKPGEEFEVEVIVENKGEDIDMDDVSINIKIMDGSDILQDQNEDDMEDDYDVGKLNNGDEEKMTFKFTMPYTVEDGDSFKIVVEADGENADDGSQKYHDEDESTGVDTQREDREVQIYKAEFDSSTLSCQRITYLNLGFRNIGQDDEETVLKITGDNLGIQETDNFDLSIDPDDDNFDVEKSYQMDFSAVPPGTYPIRIRLDNTDNKKLGEKIISVIIQDCTGSTYTTTTGTTGTGSTGSGSTGTTGTGSTGTTGTADQTIHVQYTGGAGSMPGTVVKATSPATSKPVSSGSGSLTSNPLFIVALALGNLALILIIVFALVYAFGGKKKHDDFDL